MTTWHPITTPPDSQRRVLVAQDDGYIEMAYWSGVQFECDWSSASVPRGTHWCDLPIPPTKENT